MKKIRVTVPEDVWDIIKIDQEDFGINNNKFCNYILEKLKFNRKIETEKFYDYLLYHKFRFQKYIKITPAMTSAILFLHYIRVSCFLLEDFH